MVYLECFELDVLYGISTCIKALLEPGKTAGNYLPSLETDMVKVLARSLPIYQAILTLQRDLFGPTVSLSRLGMLY